MTKTLLLTVLLLAGSSALAQGRPGQNATVELRLLSATRQGDTTTLAYRLLVGTSSLERLRSFTMNATGSPLTLATPSPPDLWMVATTWRGRGIASWAPLELIEPGDSTPTLVVRGVGLPGVTSGWFWGDSLPNESQLEAIEAAIASQYPGGVYDPLDVFAFKDSVVGIEPLPTASHFFYESRLKSLTTSACLNGWISNSTLCTNLNDLMTGTQEVLNHLAAVETGFTNGHMNSLAYWMLKVNGEATRDFLDAQQISLTYVCGNRFKIGNANYVPVTVTHRLYGTSGTDTATLGGRATDSAGPVETTIETSVAGAVQVLHNGTVIRTKTNDNVPCP